MVAVGDGHGVFGDGRALLRASGEAVPAVAQSAERRLDAPAA